MKDQWSGKTLFSVLRAKLAAPSRSSNQLNSRRIIAGPPSAPLPRRAVPETRPHGLGEVAGRPEESRAIHVQLKLWQCPRRRPEHDLGALQHVEGRLVTRTLKLVERREVQAHGASRMGADLRVADVAVGRP